LRCWAFLGACGITKQRDKDAKAGAAAPVANDLSANPDYQKGLELIAKSDCLTCHKVSEKLTGPRIKMWPPNTRTLMKMLHCWPARSLKAARVYGARSL
jgi:hypothetical protein